MKKQTTEERAAQKAAEQAEQQRLTNSIKQMISKPPRGLAHFDHRRTVDFKKHVEHAAKYIKRTRINTSDLHQINDTLSSYYL